MFCGMLPELAELKYAYSIVFLHWRNALKCTQCASLMLYDYSFGSFCRLQRTIFPISGGHFWDRMYRRMSCCLVTSILEIRRSIDKALSCRSICLSILVESLRSLIIGVCTVGTKKCQ